MNQSFASRRRPWSAVSAALPLSLALPMFGAVPAAIAADASVLDETALLWPIFALMQPLNGAVFALDGILIGASDGPYLAWSMVAAFVVCAVLSLAALAFDWGVVGVWAALVALIFVRLGLMLHRFRGRRWLVTGWA